MSRLHRGMRVINHEKSVIKSVRSQHTPLSNNMAVNKEFLNMKLFWQDRTCCF